MRGVVARIAVAAGALVVAAADARADDPTEPPTVRFRYLVVTPRIDLTPTLEDETGASRPTPTAIGAGAHYVWGQARGGVPLLYGVGADLRALTAGLTDFGGTAITAHAKGTIGHAPPFTFDLHAGGLIAGDDSGVLVGGGAYVWLIYAELGYTYQRALGVDDQPWLGHHQITIRGLIPVLRD